MEFEKNIPIYLQIINQVKRDISLGNIKLGEKLLSTREFAVKLKVNPNTISRVYKELEIEGIAFTKRGKGTFITEDKKTFNEIKEKAIKTIIDKFLFNIYALGVSKEEIIKKIEEAEVENNGKLSN